MPTLTQINSYSPAEFSSAFGAVYEHSPWIAERAFALKPATGFASRAAVHAALVAQLREHNAAYREKFGFPFIIAVRNNTQDAIFAAVTSRLNNTRAMEFNNNLMQVGEIARLRLLDIITE